MSRAETVGTLLADIANLINDGLRILSLADKRQWGLDEHEQVRALQEALDDAKKDFQDLPKLVNGQFHYERDRKREFLPVAHRTLHHAVWHRPSIAGASHWLLVPEDYSQDCSANGFI